MDGNDTIWSAETTSNWNIDDHLFEAPFKLTFTDNSGEIRIIDNKSQLRWYSHGANPYRNWRETPYLVNLTNSDGDNLYSMKMIVLLGTHFEKHFHLYFEYEINDNINITDNIQMYINLMIDMQYKFNVSVYELSVNDIGDQYIIYDPDQPMIYSLINGKGSTQLDITQSHTFLCIDKNPRYFNVEVIPFENNINIITDDANYTLIINRYIDSTDSSYINHQNDQNYISIHVKFVLYFIFYETKYVNNF